MTSLLLAIYCVTPATSSENIDHPSSLREVGSVQAPLRTTQNPYYSTLYYKLTFGTRSSHFFRRARFCAPFRNLPLDAQAELHLARRIPIVADIVDFRCLQTQRKNIDIGRL